MPDIDLPHIEGERRCLKYSFTLTSRNLWISEKYQVTTAGTRIFRRPSQSSPEMFSESNAWTVGQIHDNDSANDVRDINLDRVHVLSGPIAVEGSEPGDLLIVDILGIGPFPYAEWGFSGIFAKTNGGGFLTNHFPEAYKSIWNFEGIYAKLRHIPDVRFAGITDPD